MSDWLDRTLQTNKAPPKLTCNQGNFEQLKKNPAVLSNIEKEEHASKLFLNKHREFAQDIDSILKPYFNLNYHDSPWPRWDCPQENTNIFVNMVLGLEEAACAALLPHTDHVMAGKDRSSDTTRWLATPSQLDDSLENELAALELQHAFTDTNGLSAITFELEEAEIELLEMRALSWTWQLWDFLEYLKDVLKAKDKTQIDSFFQTLKGLKVEVGQALAKTKGSTAFNRLQYAYTRATPPFFAYQKARETRQALSELYRRLHALTEQISQYGNIHLDKMVDDQGNEVDGRNRAARLYRAARLSFLSTEEIEKVVNAITWTEPGGATQSSTYTEALWNRAKAIAAGTTRLAAASTRLAAKGVAIAANTLGVISDETKETVHKLANQYLGYEAHPIGHPFHFSSFPNDHPCHLFF